MTRAVALALLLVMLPQVAHAQPPTTSTRVDVTTTAVSTPTAALPEVGDTEALDQGDRAPWAGMLVRPDDLFALQSLAMTLQLSLEDARRLYEESRTSSATLLADAGRTCSAQLELHDRLWTDRRDELVAALSTSRAREGAQWFENPVLWLIVGAVLGGAAVGLLAAVLR